MMRRRPGRQQGIVALIVLFAILSLAGLQLVWRRSHASQSLGATQSVADGAHFQHQQDLDSAPQSGSQGARRHEKEDEDEDSARFHGNATAEIDEDSTDEDPQDDLVKDDENDEKAGAAGAPKRGAAEELSAANRRLQQQALPNHEIYRRVSTAEWLRPIPIPQHALQPDGDGDDRNPPPPPPCTIPAQQLERMYVYNDPVRTLQRYELHEKKRGGGGYTLVRQGEANPNSINPPPVVYTPGWNLSRRFGRWGAFWVRDPKPFPPTRAQVTMAEPEMYVMVFRNAWVYRGSVLQCHRYFACGACTGLQEPIQNYVHLALPNRTRGGGSKVYAMSDRHADGYYHWTHEQLPRLALMYDTLLKDESIVITAPNVSIVTQYLTDILGFAPRRVVNMNSKVPGTSVYPTAFFDTVFYPQPQRCGSTLTTPLILLRQIVFRRLNLTAHRAGPVDPNTMVVVMADRKNNAQVHRQPKNAKALLATLRRRFPTVKFITHLGLPLRKQIELFNRADLVIGPHGANLANIMWCRQGTTVLEYVPKKTGNLCYYQTASKLDLQYRMVIQDIAQDARNNISVEEVVRHVTDVYQGRTSCRDAERYVLCPTS